MEAPSLNRPTPNPDTLNMIRNPSAQQPSGSQNTQPAETTDTAHTPQEPQAGGGESVQQPVQQPVPMPQPAVVIPPGLQNVPAATIVPDALPAMPEVPVMDGAGLLMAELSAPRRDGNFQAFLEKLMDTPSFPEQINLLLEGVPLADASEEVPEELDHLMQLLPETKGQIVELLKQQVSDGSKFTGELFSVLRDAYAQSTTKGAKTEILQFLRRLNDYTSAPHIEHSMVRTLEQLAKVAPKEYREELQTFTQELGEQLSEGDRTGALKQLQGKILPFLSDISDRHPDMRLPNTLISIFKPMAARYENSSEEGLLQAFRQLAERSVLKPLFGKMGASELLKLVQKSTEEARAEEKQKFAEQLAKTADWAMKGRGGGEPRKIFRQIISNMLLNKSVYLPLEHALIPMEWNGKRLVSELWVDPDADSSKEREDETGRLIRFLLHMDIPGLGPVDLVLTSRGEEIDLQLACPASVVPFSQMIQEEMTRILENNGLKPNGIQVQKWEKPLALTKVFPKIAKGETGVNVKI